MNQLLALSSLLLLALNLTLFLLPGFAITLIAARRRTWRGERAAMLAIAASAALGYAAFWAYFGNRILGEALTYGSLVASAAVAVVLLSREPALRLLARSMAVPFGYVLAAAACYTCLLFLFQDPFATGAELANGRFFSEARPGDNQIPLILAERIYTRAPVEPFCCGDWRSSDRPPLQAGIFLFQRPLKIFGNVRLNYQLLATDLQCLWICGVWALLKTLRAPAKRVQQVLGLLIFSGFLFYNSVYVWPKLLAATFVLFAFSILLEVSMERSGLTWFQAGVAAASFALAMLAHSGSIFSAPGLVLLLWWPRRFLSVWKLLAAASVILLLLAPWVAYQKFYDPPGNRLLKMHLAGVGPIDSRSTWQAVRESYGSLSWEKIASYKWMNIEMLIGPHPFRAGISEGSRAAQRDYIWNGFGLLNAGWIALLLFRFRKNMAPVVPCSGLLLGLAAMNLMLWCLVLIGPAYTVTAHASYADLLLLSIGLLGFLLKLPRFLVLLLFLLQIGNLLTVWAFAKPALIAGAQLQIPLLIAGMLAALGLAWHFGKAIWAPLPIFQDVSPGCPLPD